MLLTYCILSNRKNAATKEPNCKSLIVILEWSVFICKLWLKFGIFFSTLLLLLLLSTVAFNSDWTLNRCVFSFSFNFSLFLPFSVCWLVLNKNFQVQMFSDLLRFRFVSFFLRSRKLFVFRLTAGKQETALWKTKNKGHNK